ncbi:response regulator [Candidatus Poribacteria bacterium]|nr:response regulator [Candidatus Poribacteria bacterium]
MKFKEGWKNRILIVDDQEDIHEVFEQILKPTLRKSSTDDLAKAFGSEIEEDFLPEFQILHAHSGNEAYSIIEKSIQNKNPIALAYIDIRMPPGWDGIQTTRKIREIDRNIEIVLMTAHSDKTLSEIIKDMDLLHKLLYISKPFKRREEIQQMTISLVEKWNEEIELEDKTRQIEISKKRLEAVLDSTQDSVAMFDVSGKLLFANKWYTDIFDLPEKNIHDIPADELRKKIRKCFQEPEIFDKTEKKALVDTSEDIVELKSPKNMILYQFVSPVSDESNSINGYITVYRDVSKEIEIDQMKSEVLRLRAELEEEYSFGNIIGKSKKMNQVYTLMKQAIQSDITVLIRGESGTGKELVAKSIHFNSSRKSGPFVAVNCAAIPDTLIESELFGHEKGSFTGASARRIGKFEQANTGTILLDEIGEMHPNLQATLLRVLQEREIQRVGGTNTIPVDVRVIASTNKDLEEAMKDGEFREDLFYRIAAFPIILPPLRERIEDIPLLAEKFLSRASEKSNKSINFISKDALQILMSYDWPGNVRELENMINRAVLLENSEVLQVSSLPHEIRSIQKQIFISDEEEEEPVIEKIPTLEEMEKQAILRALKATGDNIRQAAKILGINRATVYRKLDKYDLAGRR